MCGGGRERRTPCGVDEMLQVERSWLIRTWAPSRAIEVRAGSRADGAEGREAGLGSLARRRPRSNV